MGLEPEAMAAVAERCGEGTFVAECDVSKRDQVFAAVDAAAEALGGLDVVVANAGIASGRTPAPAGDAAVGAGD